MPPPSPRDLIRACPDLREPERRRLLALDDWVLQRLHTEWLLPHATTARVTAILADDHVPFDSVKHYRVVLQGRRAPTQSAELTANRRPPPSGEERRRGHIEVKQGVSDADLVLHEAPASEDDAVPAGLAPDDGGRFRSQRFHAHVRFRHGETVRDTVRRASSKR